MLETDQTIGAVMAPPAMAVSPETPLADVQRLMEAQTLRSVVVVDGDRAVGIVRWRDVPPAAGTLTAADVMTRGVPAIHPDTTLSTAREQIHDVDLDVVPVTDAVGRLVGEISRGHLVFRERRAAVGEGALSTSDPYDREPVVRIERGMPVRGSDGSTIGEVEQVIENADGDITHLEVRHGLLVKHTTRLPADLIAGTTQDGVRLSATAEDVDRLPDG